MRILSLLPLRARDESLSTSPGQAQAEFRITDTAEIGEMLIQLLGHHVPVSLATPDGISYTTQLVGIDPRSRRLHFAVDSRDTRLRDLVEANEALAVAYLDQVRLQFDLTALMLVHGAKDSVLQAEWPQALFRFQRRESFRVRPLEHQKPVAQLHHPDAPRSDTIALRILDLSLGGLALQLPPGLLPIQPGTRLDQVEVDLDALTRLEASLRVVHVSVLGGQGEQGTRLGCEWQRLGGDGMRALQRYIEQTQKRQRMLAAVAPPDPA
jgi:c-di-GMP-binding flagellar brake protein YcgR